MKQRRRYARRKIGGEGVMNNVFVRNEAFPIKRITKHEYHR